MRTREDYDLEGQRTPELLRGLALEKGCRAVFASDNQIQVDLDSTSLERFHKSYDLIQRSGHLLRSTAVAWRSKGGNWHIVVTLPLLLDEEISPRDRIMFALMLGSDPTREILNEYEQRHENGTIVLFRPIGAIEFTVGGRVRSDKKRGEGREGRTDVMEDYRL